MRLAEQLDTLLWQTVRARWAATSVPRAVMLILDSTVVQRYGLKQAGAEKRYNPTKKGRPSHHPLVAFLAETGDCLGVVWRPGNANTAAGAIPWIQALAYQLLHTIRSSALSGSWKWAQPERLRAWLWRLPAKLTQHARKQYVQLQRTEPLRRELLRALRRVGTGPPLAA